MKIDPVHGRAARKSAQGQLAPDRDAEIIGSFPPDRGHPYDVFGAEPLEVFHAHVAGVGDGLGNGPKMALDQYGYSSGSVFLAKRTPPAADSFVSVKPLGRQFPARGQEMAVAFPGRMGYVGLLKYFK